MTGKDASVIIVIVMPSSLLSLPFVYACIKGADRLRIRAC